MKENDDAGPAEGKDEGVIDRLGAGVTWLFKYGEIEVERRRERSKLRAARAELGRLVHRRFTSHGMQSVAKDDPGVAGALAEIESADGELRRLDALASKLRADRPRTS